VRQLAVLTVLLASTSRATEPAAKLTVQVVNSTRNGASIAGDEVVLQLYQGQKQIDSRQAKVGSEGQVVFEEVPTGPQMAAVATTKHQNMAFRSPPVLLRPTGGEFSARVQVFDVSTDTSKLSVGVHHIMVAVRSNALEFTEYLQLNNTSDLAVIGAERDEQNRPVVVRIKLPTGFRDLTTTGYLEPEALVNTGDGFYDTMAVPPGEHQVTFSYKLDIDRGAPQIVKGITLPTAELLVFWEHGQGQLEGLGEPAGRLVNAEGVPIEYHRRSGLTPGQNVTFRISGLNVKRSDAQTWIVLAVTFAALVLVAVLRLRPRATKAGPPHA
jgi:hypothetical protein